MLLVLLMNLGMAASNLDVPPPIPPSPPISGISGGGGGSSYAPSRSRYTYEEQEEDNRNDRIKKDNEFILEFLKTATDIINNQ